jgi:hypothetical protein
LLIQTASAASVAPQAFLHAPAQAHDPEGGHGLRELDVAIVCANTRRMLQALLARISARIACFSGGIEKVRIRQVSYY